MERIRGNGDFVLPLIVERKRLEIPESDGREEKAEDLLRPPPRSVGKLVSFSLFCFIYAFIFPSFFPPKFSLCPMPKKKKKRQTTGRLQRMGTVSCARLSQKQTIFLVTHQSKRFCSYVSPPNGCPNRGLYKNPEWREWNSMKGAYYSEFEVKTDW